MLFRSVRELAIGGTVVGTGLNAHPRTLARFAPKLALCTYHLPDDPEVLETLIKEANPAYEVVQKRKKLYAAVPQK